MRKFHQIDVYIYQSDNGSQDDIPVLSLINADNTV